MKTKSLLILIMVGLYNLSSFAQPYKSIFSDDTTRWHTIQKQPDNGRTIAFYSYSDTAINNKTYHKIYKEWLHSADQQIGESDNLSGYINEDTTSGKYWFVKEVDDTLKKALFMDLSLTIGDTIKTIRDFYSMEELKLYVDSVDLSNNRKVIFLSNYETEIKYIEGVGPSYGFYWALTQEPEYSRCSLICKFDNDTRIFSTEFGSSHSCFWQFAGIDDNNPNKSINVYPNPAHNNINVELGNGKQFKNWKYVIYNFLGTKINDGLIKSKMTEVKIDKTGVYLLKIFNTKNNNSFTKKIIIKNNSL